MTEKRNKMFTYDTRVGFSQVDLERKIKIESILDLFQDVCCFQSEELGVGFEYLEPRNVAWLLNSWQIDVLRFPEFNEKLTVGTAATGFHGFIADRNFVAKNEAGEPLVMASSVWLFMDMQHMRPARIFPEVIKAYPVEEPLPMEYVGRKIRIPGEEPGIEVRTHSAVKVREHHLDSNHHVNNGQYVHIAGGFFDRDKTFQRLRVEYRKQARLGDIMIPVTYENENSCIVVLNDQENHPYAVVEGTMNKE